MSETVEIGGQTYSTGCLPRVSKVGAMFPEWTGAETCPLVPRSEMLTQVGIEWAEYADENQGSNPSCCLTSLANAFEFLLSLKGRKKVRLDWLKAWKTLSGGRGGVALDTALQYVTTKGFPILDSTEVVVATEVWDTPSVDAYASGRYRGGIGIHGRYVPGGHAECVAYWRVEGGKLVARVRGSWGKSYGENGYYDVSEASLAKGIPDFGAFICRELEIRPADTTDIPDTKAG
jgi:hypothetical protein